MVDPIIVTVQLKLVPLRDDPVTKEQVLKELKAGLEEMEVRVEFGDDEAAFFVEVVQGPDDEVR